MHKSANIFGKPSATADQPQLELNGVMRGAHSYGEVAGADRRQSRTNENEYEKGAFMSDRADRQRQEQHREQADQRRGQ
ncbi:hypothetical protein D2E42_15085 [Mycobacteroides abscessus]|nr:hypothetical protein DDK10_17775 [Mycobacteroides abscessus]RIR72505.1 hypothetical protein D2E42_15085 [Mycobacteroides abscessus]SKU04722.1 Uncharacterised protein [Mycobacteroides abscessus subsp. abscessus]